MADWLEKTGRGEAALVEYRRALALIDTALRRPRRIRRLDPASLASLRAMVAEKIEGEEMARRGGERK